MNAFLCIVLSVCGVVLYVNGMPYREIFSKYRTRDDYYEDYYLRKIPKLRTSPEKIKEFIINHLSWFPVQELNNQRQVRHSFNPDSDAGGDDSQKNCHNNTKPKGNIKEKLKNFTDTHHIPTNWTGIKCQSSDSVHKVGKYIKRTRFKDILKNATHPLRYKGNLGNKTHSLEDIFWGNCSPPHPKSSHVEVIRPTTDYPAANNKTTFSYKEGIIRGYCLGKPHPKSSHVEKIKSTTDFPTNDSHDSQTACPRRTKVIIDLNSYENRRKLGRNVIDNYYLASIEGDGTNSTNVLETAEEMASDLAGRVTNLWHSVVGSHHLPKRRDIKFYLYTRRNIILPELLKVNYGLIRRLVEANPHHVNIDCIDLTPDKIGHFQRISDKNREIIKSNFLNIEAPTKILIHGYMGSYKDSRMAKIKDAYLKSGRYNVIQVDWELLAAPPCYIRVTQHSKFVGETIAQFLNGLYLIGLNMSMVHLIGFSLGAQVAGFAGNNVTLAPVCRITGLDPALPLFLHTGSSGHLDRFDADFVDIIHTCGGILAMLDPLGHVDFYPNGGTRQPGCEFSNLKCSHSRAPQYFAESVVSPKKFTAQLCLTWEDYVSGDCNNSSDTSDMGEPCSRRSTRGKYYLMTKSKEPFAL